MGVQEISTLIIGAIAVLGVFVEITPIQVNPISWILKFMGRNINSGINAQLDKMQDGIETLEEKVDCNEIDRLRYEILDFANSCRHGRRHTKEEFDHIIRANDKYHSILDSRGETNGQIDLDFQYIAEIYKKIKHDDDFIA